MLDDEPIKRELMLIKVKNQSENRSEIMTAVDVFRASVIDPPLPSETLTATDTPIH